MKLGLLTFHSLLNYGGILQALALHEILSKQTDCSVEVINQWLDPRCSPLLGKINNPNLPLYARLRNRFKARRSPIGRSEFEQRRKKTIALIHTLPLSQAIYKQPEDLAHLPHYATVVVGSDQVWNYELTGSFHFNPFLCTTVPHSQRIISYAASFGVSTLPENLKAFYYEGLSRFSAVTVRELSGAKLFSELMQTSEPPVVLDPTLLLSAEAWQKKCSHCALPPQPYLLCYWLDGTSPERIQWMREVSKRQHLPIVLLVSKPLAKLPELGTEITIRFDADPLDFVALVANASGILTDSYHGLIFASIFQRKIACYISLATSGTSASARFIDFCNRYSVPNVIVDINTIYSAPVSLYDLHELNSTLLEADRVESLSLLKTMLAR